MNGKIYYIIPAREGSKGLPHKNRKLIGYIIAQLQDNLPNVYISTDDPQIIKTYENSQINVIIRPTELAQDSTSVKDTLLHAVAQIKPSDDDLMIVLYPTYPERNKCDIDDAIKFFNKQNATSLLCKKKYSGISPYLLMYPVGEYNGRQIITHNLYRRQDYPPVFEISHFIIIIKVSELVNLNSNLYNNNTVFMNIKSVIDVDTVDDWHQLFENSENHGIIHK